MKNLKLTAFIPFCVGILLISCGREMQSGATAEYTGQSLNAIAKTKPKAKPKTTIPDVKLLMKCSLEYGQHMKVCRNDKTEGFLKCGREFSNCQNVEMKKKKKLEQAWAICYPAYKTCFEANDKSYAKCSENAQDDFKGCMCTN